jgi:hypothetical protein
MNSNVSTSTSTDALVADSSTVWGGGCFRSSESPASSDKAIHFEDSADVEVLYGVAKSGAGPTTRIEFHFVDAPLVREKLEGLVRNLSLTNVSRVPYPPPTDDSLEGRRFAWLFCQLHALEACHATVAIGGEPDGASNMLLLLAEGKRKPVVPFAFMGGAAGRAFVRRRYELEDRLGKHFVELQDASRCESVAEIAELLATSPVSAPGEVITPAMEDAIMDGFERVAFAGLEPDRYSILWLRHQHAGHHELHFVTPRVELATGKSLNIHPPGRASQTLFDTFRSQVNAEYGLADPDDPARARDVSLPNHLAKLQADASRKGQARKVDIRDAITTAVRREVNAGHIKDRPTRAS